MERIHSMDALLQLDGNILLWIQDYLRNDVFNVFWKLITHFGDGGYFWLTLTAVLLCFKKTRKTAMVAFCSIALCFLITNLCLKNVIARPRPYTQIENLSILIAPLKSYSFPSGHTANSFAIALIYFRMLPKKWGIAAVVLATLIAFSRLYLGVHYPTDVLGGFVIALFCSTVVYTIYQKKFAAK